MPHRPVALLLAIATAGFAAEPAPIPLGDRETVVIYGDSITEQNLYAAYIESFLITRFPGKDLRIYNFGWGGDTAAGGNNRFARDVAPVKPTLVTVDYGMNDGRYTSQPDQAIREGYLAAQRELAATIKAAGARQILLTTSPIDGDRRNDKDAYNESLALMADGVLALGAELGVPTADIFHPMRELQARVKAADPRFCMIPDSVHPDPVGHLVMAYQVLRRLDAPRAVGSIVIGGGKGEAGGGAALSGFRATADGMEFDLSLAFLPCPVPAGARPALAFLPFQQDLNRLSLTVAGLKAETTYTLACGPREIAAFTGAQLAAGVDLALLDAAPWTEAANRVWELGQRRWQYHYDAWRKIGLGGDPALRDLPGNEDFRKAETAYVDAIGAAMRAAAKPASWHLSLGRSSRIAFDAIEVTEPEAYAGDFAKVYAAESDPAQVSWRSVPLAGGALDFIQVFGAKDNCVVHARLVLEADRDCALRLAMGSDDGLCVAVNGKRIFAHDIYRGVKPGEDLAEVPLVKGRNVLVFRVNQGGGGFGLAVDARILGDAQVAQVAQVAPKR